MRTAIGRVPARVRLHATAGFTLVEVIIALALLSLLMLGLVSALAGFGNTAARLEARAGREGDAWLAAAFLRGALSSAVGQLRHTLPDGSQSAYFAGRADGLEWLGSMPARHGAGGLYLFRLEADGPPPRLLLRYLPYVPGATPAADAFASQVLAEGLDALRLSYESRARRPDETTHWSDTWAEPGHLPARVRIEIAAGGRAWPPLFVSIAAVDHGRAHAAAEVGD